MIRGIRHRRRPPAPSAGAAGTPDAVVWFDLFEPTEAEETRLEKLLGVDVPTLDEMAEIEEFEPALSRGGRGLHDRDPAREGRYRSPGAGAGHLHPRRAG